MNLNIWSTYISTFTIFAVSIIYSICISIKYSQYLYFYRSHFEQRVSIVFAHESKIQKSLRIMIDAVHMSHMKSNITTWSSKLKKGGCYKIYKKREDAMKFTKKGGISSKLQILLRWTPVVIFGCFWKLWPPCRMAVGQLVTHLKLIEKDEFH